MRGLVAMQPATLLATNCTQSHWLLQPAQPACLCNLRPQPWPAACALTCCLALPPAASHCPPRAWPCICASLSRMVWCWLRSERSSASVARILAPTSAASAFRRSSSRLIDAAVELPLVGLPPSASCTKPSQAGQRELRNSGNKHAQLGAQAQVVVVVGVGEATCGAGPGCGCCIEDAEGIQQNACRFQVLRR